jgi:hypothetical protein
VLALLPMMTDYFNSCARARSLGIVAQITIMREPSLIFLGQWFGFIRLPSRKYKIMSWKKKEFEDFEDLLVFILYLLETAYVYLPYTTSVPRNKALSFCVFFL